MRIFTYKSPPPTWGGAFGAVSCYPSFGTQFVLVESFIIYLSPLQYEVLLVGPYPIYMSVCNVSSFDRYFADFSFLILPVEKYFS